MARSAVPLAHNGHALFLYPPCLILGYYLLECRVPAVPRCPTEVDINRSCSWAMGAEVVAGIWAHEWVVLWWELCEWKFVQ